MSFTLEGGIRNSADPIGFGKAIFQYGPFSTSIIDGGKENGWTGMLEFKAKY